MAAGLGFKTFTTGEVLTAADTNGYLMQGVLVFASAAARAAAITSPQEGQYSYLKDTNSTEYYDGAAWIAAPIGDITGVTAGVGISGGGTSGTVTVTNSMATEITASGDIIVGTGAGTFDNLPIGTTGQILTADTTVSPYKVKWATPAGGGGKVLQVVQGTYSTEVSSSSTTYVTTGLTVSITPTSATSKIYVHAIINGLTKSSGSANNACNIRLNRNGTNEIRTWTGINYTGADGTNQGQGVIQYVDTPATTSATTYDVYFANRTASAIVYAQDGGANNQSVITVWEIGA